MYWLLVMLLKLLKGLLDEQEDRSSWDEESEEEEDELDSEVREDECIEDELACIEDAMDAGDLSIGDIRMFDGLDATAVARCWFLTADPGFE